MENKEKLVKDVLALLQGLTVQDANSILLMAQTNIGKISTVGDSKELSFNVCL